MKRPELILSTWDICPPSFGRTRYHSRAQSNKLESAHVRTRPCEYNGLEGGTKSFALGDCATNLSIWASYCALSSPSSWGIWTAMRPVSDTTLARGSLRQNIGSDKSIKGASLRVWEALKKAEILKQLMRAGASRTCCMIYDPIISYFLHTEVLTCFFSLLEISAMGCRTGLGQPTPRWSEWWV